MPSDTLLSKLVVESPYSAVANDHVTTTGAATSYFIVCAFVADTTVCAGVMLLSLLWPEHQYPARMVVGFSIAIGLCAALLLQSGHHRISIDEARSVLYTETAIRITLQTSLLLLPVSLLLHPVFPPPRSAWLALLAMPIMLTLERRAIDSVWHKIWTAHIAATRVVVLGPADVGRRLAAKLLSSPGLGLIPVALLNDHEADPGEFHRSDYRGVPVLNVSLTGNILRALQCDLLVVANSESTDSNADGATVTLDEIGVRVISLRRSNLRDGSFEMNDSIEHQLFSETNTAWYYFAAKRSLDVFLSCIFLIILLPLLLATALLIRLESPGPALFIQERIGLGGVRFAMYKFRSMTYDARPYERSPTLADDPRITRIGRLLRRTSLDELPQLLNVLLGHMSLVGPRPEMPPIVAQYSAHHRLRLQVIPGITGLWQLSKDRAYPIHENLHHDLTYIKRRSISLDIAILVHTLFFAMRGGM